MTMLLSIKDYKEKTLGCWLGKNIGGTLGAPMEWHRQLNSVSFYTQDLNGEPLPNDDLDIQLLWLVAIEEQGIDKINARLLGDYWTMYVTPHWAEYGNAKINMKSGIMPPLSGNMNNPYKDSCGCFIRSEIWATIAPGAPEIAVRLAYEDAMIDHGDGEGTYAEVFCVTLEAAAYLESDIYKLIDIGLSYIPEDCETAKAIRCAMDCYRQKMPWEDARIEVLRNYRGSTFFKMPECCSEADRALGLEDGKLGFDAPSNIGMLMIGLLYGEGDFDKSLCITVNCGEDTDCTGATLGSIFGLIHGASAIPEKWITPIGNGIKTACLNLGELYMGSQLPSTVHDLTERTLKQAKRLTLRHNSRLQITDNEETSACGFSIEQLMMPKHWSRSCDLLSGPVYVSHLFKIAVDYASSCSLEEVTQDSGHCLCKNIVLRIFNLGKTPEYLNIKWYLPSGASVSPRSEKKLFVTAIDKMWNEVPYTVSFNSEEVKSVNRAVIEITLEGRSFVQLIPIILIHESF